MSLEITRKDHIDKLTDLSERTGKSIEWHIFKMTRRYLIHTGQMSAVERMAPDRADCMRPCMFIPGSEKCKGCNEYWYGGQKGR